MKKILFILLCFLFIGVVDAETLSIGEIIEGFRDSRYLDMYDPADVEVTNNTANSTIDIHITANGNNYTRSYSYAEGFIHFTDDRAITLETASDQFIDALLLGALSEGIINLSGFDAGQLNEIPDNFVFDFDRYGFYVRTEDYSFDVDGSVASGDFIRDFKIGFDTDKIANYVEDVGYKEDAPALTDKVPTVKIVKKTSSAITINVFVDDSDNYECELYRSTTKNGNYESLGTIGCYNKNMNFVDDSIKKNTTYYYKAKSVGGDTFSKIVSTGTSENGDVVNPKTGSNQALPLIIGFVLGIGALVLFRRNSVIKL